MKIKFTLLAFLGISLTNWLFTPALRAQIVNTNTNALPLTATLKYQVALESDQSLGERALLAPGLKEKLKLTDTQRLQIKPTEDDFANTSQQYQIANQPRIDAAQESARLARAAGSATQIQSARKQLQDVWAGLQPYRDAAVKKIKPLLTPEQIVILDDKNNQWSENHANEANDPSAN